MDEIDQITEIVKNIVAKRDQARREYIEAKTEVARLTKTLDETEKGIFEELEKMHLTKGPSHFETKAHLRHLGRLADSYGVKDFERFLRTLEAHACVRDLSVAACVLNTILDKDLENNPDKISFAKRWNVVMKFGNCYKELQAKISKAVETAPGELQFSV